MYSTYSTHIDYTRRGVGEERADDSWKMRNVAFGGSGVEKDSTCAVHKQHLVGIIFVWIGEEDFIWSGSHRVQSVFDKLRFEVGDKLKVPLLSCDVRMLGQVSVVKIKQCNRILVEISKTAAIVFFLKYI